MNIVYFALFGLVIGALAKLLMPGRDPGGVIVTAIIGMVGSALGAFIGQALGLYRSATTTAGWAMSLVGAVVLLMAYRLVMGRRASA